MWLFVQKTQVIARPSRWVIDLERYGMKDNEPKFTVERYELRGGDWGFDKTFGTFDTREEAEAWIRKHGDLPYEVTP